MQYIKGPEPEIVDAPTEAEILACLKKEELDELDVRVG